jgi:signal transduction histidine kinase
MSPPIKWLHHDVVPARDLDSGLAAAIKKQPDLVIVCQDSLKQQAFELCQKIKSDERLQDTAVLLVSSSADPHVQVRAFDSGANDILVGPRNELILSARVRALLKYRNAVRELRAAHADMERRVAERTAELQRSNEELKREMAERQKTEAALLTTEEMFRHLQKVEALGQLAGGVAHDFNNILFVILGHCELLEAKAKPGDPLLADVGSIRSAGQRAAELTRQLLAFGRRQVLKPQALDLNVVVSDMATMLRRLIGEHIELVANLSATPVATKADRVQIEQVIMNLVVNARDAMPKGGTLTVETANVVLDEAQMRSYIGARAGPHVRLAISDTGCGISTEAQAHLFEPFYTTKEPGKGTGLGLAMVYGIVKQSGGSIWARSALGKGTRFDVYLPCAEEPVAPKRADSGTMPVAGPVTVLLVEDEESVRDLARRFLEDAGFTVLEARGGNEALEVHKRYRDVIHVLLTDVVMPKMSGQDLADELTRTRPNLRVLYMSGYARTSLDGKTAKVSQPAFSLDPATAFLQKPFTKKKLVNAIREVLAGPG